MKTTKLRAGIAILSLSALALTGCGNGGNGGNDPAPNNGQNAFKYSGTKDGAETSIFVDAADGKTVIAIEGNASDLVSDEQVNVGNQSATGQKAQDAKGRARISNINEQFNIQAPSQDQIVDMKELMGSPNGSNF